ncbi:hypothetical protein [Pseudoalteromonas sp. APC 4017]|nr:hypothetical protein [Pseudoalteromonas sp. APC 4017]MDN3379816.1 hypothetical protein [Pseudoalteromonas sp. APC 3893]MDN3388156.1 hypothetical protein [Pseudoalteromonas sp. APC 4017]
MTKHLDITEQQPPITLAIGKANVSLPPTTPVSYLSQLLRELA